mgnify:CR=1 FL=1
MADKSHVGMGHQQCLICGTKHDEAVLLDKRLRKTLTRDMLTGNDSCPECSGRLKEGYIALLGVDPERSVPDGNTLRPENAHRTGDLLWIKKDIAKNMFNMKSVDTPFMFIEPEGIKQLTKMAEAANAQDN